MDNREIILDVLMEIFEEGKLSHVVINQNLKKYRELEKQERSFISKVCIGTIERRITLDYEIEKYSKITVAEMRPLIRNILRMAVYQILYMDQIPQAAACNEAVKLTKKRNLPNLSRFVNGVLRNLSRGLDNFLVFPDEMEEVKRLSILYSMPEWIVSRWISEFGTDTTVGMLSYFHKEQRISVRVNESKISKEELIDMLRLDNVTVEEGTLLPEALLISGFNSVDRIESFRQGYFQVQDESSMLVGRIAGVKAGDTVIDVTAAPGGKSIHIADLLCRLQKESGEDAGQGKVYARDITYGKVNMIYENIKRIGFENIEPQIKNALTIYQEDIRAADIVIADLPCSGLGVMGRKPDIRYRLKEEKLIELAGLQKNILKVVSRYVKKGGVLIYSTCTVCKEENENNFEFLLKHLGFAADSLMPYLPQELTTGNEATAEKGYIQILPGICNLDGFFLSRAIKL